MALRGVASGYSTTKVSSVTVNVAAIGIQYGDLILLLMQGGGGTANTYTVPSGFQAAPGLTPQDVTGDSTQALYWKPAGSSEPATYSIGSNQTDYQTLHCRVYSGRNTVTPFGHVAETPTSYNNPSPVTLTLTPLANVATDDVMLFIANKFYDGSIAPSFAPAAGFANANTVYGNAQYSPVITACDYCNAPAGTTTSGGVMTVTGHTDCGYAAFSVALTAANPYQYPIRRTRRILSTVHYPR